MSPDQDCRNNGSVALSVCAVRRWESKEVRDFLAGLSTLPFYGRDNRCAALILHFEPPERKGKSAPGVDTGYVGERLRPGTGTGHGVQTVPGAGAWPERLGRAFQDSLRDFASLWFRTRQDGSALECGVECTCREDRISKCLVSADWRPPAWSRSST